MHIALHYIILYYILYHVMFYYIILYYIKIYYIIFYYILYILYYILYIYGICSTIDPCFWLNKHQSSIILPLANGRTLHASPLATGRQRYFPSMPRPFGARIRWPIERWYIYIYAYSYGHLLVIIGYKWDSTCYKWGYKYL